MGTTELLVLGNSVGARQFSRPGFLSPEIFSPGLAHAYAREHMI